MAANTIYSQYLTDEEQRRRALAAQQTLAQAQAEADAAKGSFTKISTPQAGALPTSNDKTMGAVSNLISAALPANKPAAQTGAAVQSSSSLPTSNDKTMGTVSRLLSAAGGNMENAPVIATVYNPSMSAPKKVVMENSVKGGSGFKAADGDAGKIRLYKDGTQRVVDADGVWHWYDPSPIDSGLHGAFRSSNGMIYSYDDMTDEELYNHGYYRDANGRVSIMPTGMEAVIAAQKGLITPEQAAVAAYNRNGSSRGPASGGSTPGGGNIYSSYLNNYEYNGGNYGRYDPTDYRARRDAALARAEGMEWDYDPNTDPVWNAYQKQYRREGDRATQETMAQAAAMTGGIPSSYAATAASQAGDYYAAQLSDKIPQLYNDAYNRYLNEFQRQLQISDQYQGFDDREYSRQYQAQRDAISDARYDQEWAQKLREYADEQSWKAKDWEQYLREYGDKLSDKEREWAYKQQRDAIEDERKSQEYADEQAWKSTEWEQYLKEHDETQAENERTWAYKERAYTDQQKATAWSFFETYGFVPEEYADILGIPAGTTWEQYWARYGAGSDTVYNNGSGGSSSGGKQSSTPTGNPEGKPKALQEPEQEQPKTPPTPEETTPERTDIVGTHKNGDKKTRGYTELANYLASQVRNGFSASQIRNTVYQWASQDRIADWEIPIILGEFGLWDSSDTSMSNPYYEGNTRQYTK